MRASHANGLPPKPQNPTHAAASWRERYRRSTRPAEADSGWNPNAVSPAGDQGLSLFMPGTGIGEGVDGDGDGVRDPFDPADAIASQASFMCKLLAAVSTDDSLTGDPIDLALAAYNARLGAVQRHNGVPPFPETQGYVRRIRALMADYADPTGTAPGARPPGSWVRPIIGPITSGFGPRWGRAHAGIDFGAPIGTPVYAASNGTVTAAGPPAATASGSSPPTPATSAPCTATSAPGRSPSAKPSKPARSSPTAATKAAAPDRTCTSRPTPTAVPSTQSRSTPHTQ